jgi:hypothetical protein
MGTYSLPLQGVDVFVVPMLNSRELSLSIMQMAKRKRRVLSSVGKTQRRFRHGLETLAASLGLERRVVGRGGREGVLEKSLKMPRRA